MKSNSDVPPSVLIFQESIRELLLGIPERKTFNNDIIVHDRSQEEQDLRLKIVVQLLVKKNVTLKRNACSTKILGNYID